MHYLYVFLLGFSRWRAGAMCFSFLAEDCDEKFGFEAMRNRTNSWGNDIAWSTAAYSFYDRLCQGNAIKPSIRARKSNIYHVYYYYRIVDIFAFWSIVLFGIFNCQYYCSVYFSIVGFHFIVYITYLI